jgi:hypothetical protein
MLQLNEEQLRRIGRESFRDAMVRFVTQQFEAAGSIDRAELHRDVDSIVEAARRYGLTTFAAAGVFTVLSWVYGKGFELGDQALLGVLDDMRIAPGEKARCLEIWGLGAASELSGERA